MPSEKQFVERWPEWKPIFDIKYYKQCKGYKSPKGIRFIMAPCCQCGNVVETRVDHLVARHYEDGKFTCNDCRIKNNISICREKTNYFIAINKANTRRSKESMQESSRKRWKTIVSKKPGFKPNMDDIEWHFIHLMQDDSICPDPDAHHAPKHIDGVFELDGYSPKYHKGFECDEEGGHFPCEWLKRHRHGAPLGYHHNKDVHASEQGDIIFHFVKEEYLENPEDVEERFIAWYRYGTETVPSRWDTVEYPWLLL